MRFAVISDPHAVVGPEHRHDTYARKETAEEPALNPFAALRKMIEDSHKGDGEPLRADALLCPGDLANKMCVKGLAYAWKEIVEIGKLLAVERIVATAGNHDVLRHEDMEEGMSSEEWIAALRGLTPRFPSCEADESDHYFRDDFMVAEGERWRVIALNSCATYAEANQSRFGKIEQKTLQHLGLKVAKERKDINVLMCHHHPLQWSHLRFEDTSYMRGGDRLIQSLEHDDPGRWIVLHGHRHVPAIGYSGDSISGPVRISAGSLAVCLPKEARADIRNQFYMLEFDLQETERLELVGAGHVRAWDWALEGGIIPAEQSAELPGRGGFGFRRDAHALVRMCRERASALGARSVTWQELLDGDERWAYVAPRDLRMLRRALELDGALVEPPSGEAHIERVSFAP